MLQVRFLPPAAKFLNNSQKDSYKVVLLFLLEKSCHIINVLTDFVGMTTIIYMKLIYCKQNIIWYCLKS
jgi:hypothetical protein